MSDPAIEGPDPTLSRDSRHSTVSPDPEAPDTFPPSGPHLIEELGRPKETKASAASKKASQES